MMNTAKVIGILFLSLLFLTAKSQNAADEKEAIKKTLLDYIEGTGNGQPERIKKAFHSELNLYSVLENGKLKTWNGKEYISLFKPGQKRNRQGKILAIDYENNAATAKVEIKTPGKTYIDYFLLLKLEEGWKIIHKSYTQKIGSK